MPTVAFAPLILAVAFIPLAAAEPKMGHGLGRLGAGPLPDR
jgi:hypothetical protein